MAEELEVTLEASEKEHKEQLEHAVAHAQKALNDKHQAEMDKAAAALNELEALRLRAAERAYAPGGAAYGGVQSRFEQRQRGQADYARGGGAKRRRVVCSPST